MRTTNRMSLTVFYNLAKVSYWGWAALVRQAQTNTVVFFWSWQNLREEHGAVLQQQRPDRSGYSLAGT